MSSDSTTDRASQFAAHFASHFASLPDWENVGGKAIARTFKFKNYYETMAFVNAIAFIAHRQDHHPDLQVGFNKCRVEYSTHSAGGLSEKDFAAVRAVEGLLK